MRFAVLLTMLLMAACSRRPSDEWIAAQIKAKFLADPVVETASLTVAVTGGEVTLSGTSHSPDAEWQAFKLAMATDGVRRIHDEIVVAPAVDRTEKADAGAAPTVASQAAREVTPAAYLPSPPPPPEEIQIVHAPPVVERVQTPPVEAEAGAPAPAEVALWSPPPPVNELRSPATPEPDFRKPEREALVELNGAGSAFPLAFYTKWFAEYRDARIRYQARRSAEALADRGLDFIGSDVAVNGERRFLSVPAAIAGVAVICNVEGQLRELNLSGQILAAIYDGRITHWDHPSIRELNPNAHLPYLRIVPVHRTDAAASTAIFTSFLRARAGAAVNVAVAGLPARGNDGVTQLVKLTPEAIGYVDLNHALEAKLPYCAIQNRAGQLVKPNLASLTASAGADGAGRGAYPLAGLTWLVVPVRFAPGDKARAMRSFLAWMLKDGQAYPASFGFAPLPKEMAAAAEIEIRRIH